MMYRLKESLLFGGVSETYWRNFRAENLAFFIALHRRTRWPTARRVIMDDIVEDIGWPRSRWLKGKVREHLDILNQLAPRQAIEAGTVATPKSDAMRSTKAR